MKRALLPFIAVLFLSRSAYAGSLEAQALFDEGKRLMANGAVDEACDRFERSQRLEPAGGTVLHLALCREKQGKTATAYELFNQALSAARSSQRKDREQAANEHITDLEPKLMRLRIVVPRPARLDGLEIIRDGKPVDAAGWDVAVPVDPGPHEIAAKAPGHAAWTKRVDVARAGSVTDVEVPVLTPSADASPPKKKGDADVVADDGSSQRTLAIVALGVGVVGVGVGSVFGIMSAAAHDETNRICGGPAPAPCPQEGIDEADKAQVLGNVSTVAFIVGAIGVTAGAVLWFTAPAKSKQDAAFVGSLLRGRITF